MSLKKSIGALAGALVLGVSLVACGGGASTPDLAGLRDELVGTWELASADSADETWDEGVVDDMADAGMLVTLDLDEDGNLIYNEVGNQQDGSWSVKDDGGLTFEIGGATVDVPYEDDQLTLKSGDMTMVFEKESDEPNMDRQPEDNAGALDEGLTEDVVDDAPDDLGDDVDTDDFAYVFTDDMIYMQEMIYLGAEQTAPLDVTVADDETLLFQVTGLATDFEGDTGYLVHIENRTDTDLVISNQTTELDGSDVYDYATLLCTVRAGESADGFFYFDSDYCTVSESSSLIALFAAQDINQTPVGIWTLTL
ncbi:hypothetical protein [Thermophilibacter sp.]|uniref:hypothetical protein n=1 Tax=Thermophilibacter sp. TaxID=2847309 RepID=UPI003A9378AC